MTIRYFGNVYTVELCAQFDERLLWFDQDRCMVVSASHDEAHVRRLLHTWLEREARRHLITRVRELSEHTGWEIRRIAFRRQSSIWGSCSRHKHISLNTQLIHLPHHLIDYVIIHELAHTQQMNHSRAFWDLVGRHCPTYRQDRLALRAEARTVRAAQAHT